KKVQYEFIANERARTRTFKKRKTGLLKKVSELQTLCGVDACAFIYSSRDSQTVAWPSSLEAYHVLERFKNMPTGKQTCNMMDQEILLNKNLIMLDGNLKKETRKNQGLEMEQLLLRCLANENLHDFSWSKEMKIVVPFLDDKIKLVTNKIKNL
ncbi:unnamed protein product, partial [Ilex paraguariensis]